MTHILKFAAVALIAGATTFSMVSTSAAQSTGHGGKGSSQSGPESKGEPDNYVNPGNRLIKRAPSRNDYPTFGYQVKPEGNSTCVLLWNQITPNNMLVTVPRYNECMRRGRNQ